MANKFYMDVHVPLAVTEGLRRRGVDVLTAQEDGSHKADDESLLNRATGLGRVLFTQDRDLLTIAARCQNRGKEFGGVVYSHQLSSGIGSTVEDLELLATCADTDEVQNQVFYLPIR